LFVALPDYAAFGHTMCRVVTPSGQRPFDRHDWIVDRCGTEVRYIIDYYHDDTKDKGLDKVPQPSAKDLTVQSITMHVLPALDSVSGWSTLWAAAKQKLFGKAKVAAPPAVVEPPTPSVVFPNTPLSDDEFKFLSALRPASVAELNAAVSEKCGPISAAYAQQAAAGKFCFGVCVCASWVNAHGTRPR
jgi:Cytochrome c/c1 heme lyase